MYHAGNRALQAQFGSTALADRLVEKLHRERFTDADKLFIESLSFFFLATADTEARPDCSFKGGPAGFVRVISPELLVFPDYDGNGMFKSLGNISQNEPSGDAPCAGTERVEPAWKSFEAFKDVVPPRRA
ncbi:MAG TPA: pyridoxamine 5'-phosphate oxidase family protein [Polyangiales bacterium]